MFKMAYYNDTFINSSNTLLELVEGVNTESSGLLSVMLLFTLFVVSFIVFKRYDTMVTAIVSAFITSIVGIILWAMGLISWAVIIIPIVILFFAIVGKLLKE